MAGQVKTTALARNQGTLTHLSVREPVRKAGQGTSRYMERVKQTPRLSPRSSTTPSVSPGGRSLSSAANFAR